MTVQYGPVDFFFVVFFLYTELWAITETSVISQGTYFSDICQVLGIFYA